MTPLLPNSQLGAHTEPRLSDPGLGLGIPSVPPTSRLPGLCASGVQNATVKISITEGSGKEKRNGKIRSGEVVSFLSPRMIQPSTLVMLVRKA